MSKYDRWRASKNIFEIVPHDTDEILTDSIRAPSDGVITFRALDDSVDVSHPVRAGEVIPVRTRYIRASGTTVMGSILAYAVTHKDYTQYTNLAPDIIKGLNNVLQPSTATVLNQFGFVASPDTRTNLCPYSSQFDVAGWVKTNCTVTANTQMAPDGTMTADTWSRSATTNAFINRGVTKTGTPIQYTFSVHVKKGSAKYFAMRMQGTYPARADVTFDLDTGSVSLGPTVNTPFIDPAATITPLADAWFRCTLTAITDSATIISLPLSFLTVNNQLDASGSIATAEGYLWGAQLELGNKATAYIPTTTAAVTSTLPRFEYDMGEPIVGASRTNLTPWSQALDNAAWSKTNTPMTSGATLLGLPAFTVSSTANLNSFIRSFSPQPLQFSTTYTRTIFAKAVSGSGNIYFEFSIGGTQGSAWFNLLTGVATINAGLGTVSMQDMGDGVWRCRHTFTTTNTGTPHHRGVYIGVYGNSPTVTTVILTGDQLEVGSEPTDYIPTYASAVTTNLTYNPVVRGLLVEPARTNLCTHSENPTNGVWNPTGVVKTSTSEPDPFGTNKAALITALSGNQSHYLVGGNASITYERWKDYTFSVFLKVGSQKIVQIAWAAAIFGAGYFNIDIENGVVGGGFGGVARVVNMTDGWCRVSLTMTAIASGLSHAGGLAIVSALDSTRLEANPLTTNFYAVGWQLEQAPEPSSYIPTTTAAVTRSADLLTLNYTDKPDGVYTARLWHSDYDYTEVDNLTVLGGQVNITGVTTKPITKISLVFKSYLLRTQFPDVLPSQYNVIQPSVAMRVSAAGVVGSPGTRTNLLFPSTNVAWGLTPGATITSNVEIAPDGTQTADRWARSSVGANYAGKNSSKPAAALAYTSSLYVKKGTARYFALRSQGDSSARADVVFDLENGAVSFGPTTPQVGFENASATITHAGNGWFRCTLSTTTDTSNIIRFLLSFSASNEVIYGSSASADADGYIWGAQLEQAAEASNYIPTTTAAVTNTLPRFDYNAGILRGLLVEPARTNLLRASETFTTGWSVNNFSLVTGNVAPDGTSGGLLATFGASNYAVCPATVVPSTPYTASVFVKWVAGTPRINLGCGKTDSTNGGLATFDVTSSGVSLASSGARGPGTFVGYTITPIANGWFRLTCTGYGTDVSGGIAITAAAVGTQLLLWGAQVEQGSEASSYTPTTTAAVTRPADRLNLTGLNKANGRYTARCWHSDSSYTDVPNITVTNGAASIIGVSVKPIQTITFI